MLAAEIKKNQINIGPLRELAGLLVAVKSEEEGKEP